VNLDFAVSSPILYALAVLALQPVFLLALTRSKAIRGRNAAQFALSFATVILVWASLMAASGRAANEELVAGLMMLAAGEIFYLEIWALLSRGYTLGILTTLLVAGRPLEDVEVAARYRAGDGLAWIMEHRLRGLIAAGLVSKRGDLLVLSPLLGVATARLYRFSVRVLGLRRTG
jgi:hypothetical protein